MGSFLHYVIRTPIRIMLWTIDLEELMEFITYVSGSSLRQHQAEHGLRTSHGNSLHKRIHDYDNSTPHKQVYVHQ